MRRWTYDYRYATIRAVECEKRGYPHKTASGGDAYELEAVEMTKEEWEAVPDDFPGW